MLCAGVELMSHYGMGSDVEAAMKAECPVRFTERAAEIGMITPQGVCAEMISEEEGHTREELDRFGMWSMQKAVEAQRKGWFDNIIPFEYTWEGETRKVDTDEGLRPKALDDPDAYCEDMKRLPTPFKQGGRVTAGVPSGGIYVRPAIVEIEPGAPIVQQETFAPVHGPLDRLALTVAKPRAGAQHSLEPFLRLGG